MKLLSSKYQKTLQKYHKNNRNWGTGTVNRANQPTINKLLKERKVTSLLNYGCGKATIKYDIPTTLYDPGIPEYSELPIDQKWDFFISLDVMEHIEPFYLDDNLKWLSDTCDEGFMVICLVKAFHVLPDGQNAHLIVQDADWWRENLNKYFTIRNEYPVKHKALAVHVSSNT